MQNKTRFAALAGAAVGVAGLRAAQRAHRHARRRQTAGDIADVVTPLVEEETPPTSPLPAADKAHAPGHRHLPLTAEIRNQPAPPPVRERPFAKHRHGLRQPGKG
jgi:hypothetical protein